MLSFTGSLRVFLCVEPCDMRMGCNSLSALVADWLHEDLRGGALFAFTNKRRTRLKLLYFDRTGLWLATKRLEQGTFAWPPTGESAAVKLQLTPEAFALLVDGIDLRDAKLRPWYVAP